MHLYGIQRPVDHGFGHVDQMDHGKRKVAFHAGEVFRAFTGRSVGAPQQPRSMSQGFFEGFIGWIRSDFDHFVDL